MKTKQCFRTYTILLLISTQILSTFESPISNQFKHLIYLNSGELNSDILLEWLNVKHASDTYMLKNTFMNRIDIEYFSINSLSPDLFNYLSSELYFVSLGNNFIQNLNGTVFKNMAKLEYLLLQNNQITELDEHLLSDLNNLTYLDLENNQISSISRKFITRFNSLCIAEFFFYNNACNVEVFTKLEGYRENFTGRRRFRTCLAIRSTSCQLI